MCSHARNTKYETVPDPYYGGESGFELVSGIGNACYLCSGLANAALFWESDVRISITDVGHTCKMLDSIIGC